MRSNNHHFSHQNLGQEPQSWFPWVTRSSRSLNRRWQWGISCLWCGKSPSRQSKTRFQRWWTRELMSPWSIDSLSQQILVHLQLAPLWGSLNRTCYQWAWSRCSYRRAPLVPLATLPCDQMTGALSCRRLTLHQLLHGSMHLSPLCTWEQETRSVKKPWKQLKIVRNP